jgi:transcriptional regulator with XRE-family HTH domain
LRVTQSDIARQVGLDVSSVNKILNNRTDASFNPRTIQDVLRAAQELGYDLSRAKHAHERRHVRKDVMVAVELSVYGGSGALHDRGTAVARNVSLAGALLIAISLPRHTIPLGSCTIGLRRLGASVPMPEILGRIVRFQHAGESLGMAVQYLEGQEERAAAFYKSLPAVRGESRRTRKAT